jgi:predicted nuclease of predicted toxin-antitoxin system
MKVLIDECSPKALKRYLADYGHECVTVQQAGWAGKKNGELLDLAEPLFDVLVTSDTNVQYQQILQVVKLRSWFSTPPPIDLNTFGSTFRTGDFP